MGAPLPAAVRAFFAEHRITGPGVVAVSGGADSVALLRALEGVEPLIVAHFHHGLRGAEADADAAFVRELAGRLGCRFELGGADVRAAGGNLEAAARRLRYGWLAEVAAATGAAWVATGHTADDQAETVLHRLVRGTGLRGLRGIAAAMPLGTVQLVRPLLAVGRVDVLAFLADLGQPFRTDTSNADPRFTRNRVRAELLPLLTTFNPAAPAALTRAAEQSSEAFDLIDRLAAELLGRAELPRAGDLVILDSAAIVGAVPLLAREAFRRVWEREGWPTSQFRAAHWHRLLAVAHGDPAAADFPGGTCARRVGRVVRLGRQS
ncbi:tRNA lysidine(34) synthetase TilS [Urbifossiella limnaea]|uniref:tRNA(Ile)-lysidine synthase n=1 Tax=Urbifossiella limnaea TaxID=2528023 RepID=A0A517XRK5_9BACT|nr:tRNA lysidine(34) synthetase TilS [Urbifossiella limnaea]QDU20150.1 tRNA(Ile)-lysidine synthase [Urbifossiella limnaea]